jgi:hypothetical protein
LWPHARSQHGRMRPCLPRKTVQSNCKVSAPYSTSMLISAVTVRRTGC